MKKEWYEEGIYANIPKIGIVGGPDDGMIFVTNPELYPENYLFSFDDNDGNVYYYEYDEAMNSMMFRGYENEDR